jgi:fidgetin-like protein 1
LLTQRSDNENEASRRIKTEFLVQFDGVGKVGGATNDERILVIGATNRPQELDDAARRRLVKRLYIPLPEPEARQALIRHLLRNENHCLQPQDFHLVAEKCAGYSGSDITALCTEAALMPVRSVQNIETVDSSQVRSIT